MIKKLGDISLLINSLMDIYIYNNKSLIIEYYKRLILN